MKHEETISHYTCDVCEKAIDRLNPYEIHSKHVCNECIDKIGRDQGR